MKNNLKTFHLPLASCGLNASGDLSKTTEIIDIDGNPLVGAHVKWGSKGTVTDANGEATVSVASSETMITITYMGKRSHTTSFASLGGLITLQDAVDDLPDVVVHDEPISQPKSNKMLYTALIGVGLLIVIASLKKTDKGLNAPKPKVKGKAQPKRTKTKTKPKKKKGLREPAITETIHL